MMVLIIFWGVSSLNKKITSHFGYYQSCLSIELNELLRIKTFTENVLKLKKKNKIKKQLKLIKNIHIVSLNTKT